MILLKLERTIKKQTVFFRVDNMWPAVGIGITAEVTRRRAACTIIIGPFSLTLCSHQKRMEWPQFAGSVGRSFTFDDEKGEFIQTRGVPTSPHIDKRRHIE